MGTQSPGPCRRAVDETFASARPSSSRTKYSLFQVAGVSRWGGQKLDVPEERPKHSSILLRCRDSRVSETFADSAPAGVTTNLSLHARLPPSRIFSFSPSLCLTSHSCLQAPSVPLRRYPPCIIFIRLHHVVLRDGNNHRAVDAAAQAPPATFRLVHHQREHGPEKAGPGLLWRVDNGRGWPACACIGG